MSTKYQIFLLSSAESVYVINLDIIKLTFLWDREVISDIKFPYFFHFTGKMEDWGANMEEMMCAWYPYDCDKCPSACDASGEKSATATKQGKHVRFYVNS